MTPWRGNLTDPTSAWGRQGGVGGSGVGAGARVDCYCGATTCTRAPQTSLVVVRLLFAAWFTMVVVKVGGNRGQVLAQIEARNEKLRKKQELQYTKEIYKKFDSVRQPDR